MMTGNTRYLLAAHPGNAMQKGGSSMSPVLLFIREWNKWYRVLRNRKGFGLLDSVRYGVWLAHS